MGFSTLIDARMFLDTILTPNTQSIIIAQDEINSKKLFQVIKRFYSNLPFEQKLIAKTDNQSELWWNQIDSYFFVGWAGSKKIGRGGTVNNVHGSEVAFWENAGDIIAGLLQSVPLDGNVILESTANGVGNYFFKEYQAAIENDSVYKARFYGWNEDPDYQMAQLVGDTFLPEETEKKLISLYGLSTEQLIWRRHKILELKNAKMSGSEVGDFPQEYPLTATEAFISTGNTIFSTQKLEYDYLPKCIHPLESVAIPIRYENLNQLRNTQSGRLSVFKLPDTSKEYLLIADPSEGIDTDGDHDYCGTHIIDVTNWEQVATLHGRWEPNDYAQLLGELGKWYCHALIAVERNNHGHSVLNTLQNTVDYGRMSGWHGIYEHVDYEQKNAKRRQLGYPINLKTKAIALAALSTIIEDESIIINEKATIQELKVYSKLPGGRTGASIGHDDRVTSLAIGAAILTDNKFLRRKTRKVYGTIGTAVRQTGRMM